MQRQAEHERVAAPHPITPKPLRVPPLSAGSAPGKSAGGADGSASLVVHTILKVVDGAETAHIETAVVGHHSEIWARIVRRAAFTAGWHHRASSGLDPALIPRIPAYSWHHRSKYL